MRIQKIGLLPKDDCSADRLLKLQEYILNVEKRVQVTLGIRSKREIELAEGVLRLQKEHPCIFLECVLPYETVANDWDEESRDRFFRVMEHCGRETLLQTKYTAAAMEQLEAYIRSHADTQV